MKTSVYNQGVASLPRRFQEGGTVRAAPSYQDRSKEIALLQQELDTFEGQMPEGYYDRNDNLRNLRTKRIDSINQRIAEEQRIQSTPTLGETRYERVGPEGEVLGRYKSENSALIAAGRPPELGPRGVETAGDFQTAREFRSVADRRLKEAGLGFQERGTLMGTLDSLASAGFRPNYQAISQSSDPIAAARQASRQLIEAGAYDQAPGVSSVSSLTKRAPVGESEDLLRLVSNLSSERLGPTAELIGATPGGVMLGNMGATADQIRNRLLNFGQGLTQEQIDALKQQAVDQYGDQITSGFGPGGGIYSALSELSPFDAPAAEPDQQYFYSFDQAVMDPLSPQNTAATTASEALMTSAQPAVAQQPAFQDTQTFAQGPFQQPAAMEQFMSSPGNMSDTLSQYYSQLYASPYFGYYGTPYMSDPVFDQGVYNPQGNNQ